MKPPGIERRPGSLGGRVLRQIRHQPGPTTVTATLRFTRAAA
ncbi:hypothetical protein OR263_34105 [Streptomyces sp. NEAU-H22]|nr:MULTISPECIES: hypothetical protein [unclassified Streptomyces]MCX3291685.1 hypothetical protein [Streptomyces sp. NEAU-H22]WMD04725.1 hypothetical protein Q7C01_10125 [Streptomyces sp. FXY-T5]